MFIYTFKEQDTYGQVPGIAASPLRTQALEYGASFQPTTLMASYNKKDWRPALKRSGFYSLVLFSWFYFLLIKAITGE